MPLVVLPLAHGFQAIDFKARFRFRNAAMAVGAEGAGMKEKPMEKKGLSFKI